MYLAPVKGTDLIVASTTYIEEFSKPSQAIEVRMKQIERGFLEEYEEKSQIFYFIILVVLIILLAVIYFYSRSVVRPIRHLSEVADKISMGELIPHPDPREGGGRSAESIERMQTSVKAAIERLQREEKMTLSRKGLSLRQDRGER
jgi:HAMP domain-containing protein